MPTDIRKLALWALLGIGPLVLINISAKKNSDPWYMTPFSITGSAMQAGYSWLDSSVRDSVQLYVNLVGIKKQSRKLLEDNQLLQSQMSVMQEVQAENTRLRKLLEFKEKTEMKMTPAQVIGVDLMGEHSTITINKGSLQGIQKGQAVITTKGVAGYILKVDPTTAMVLLLTDRYAVIDAIVQRTRARGIVEGTGTGQAKLRYLERIEDVEAGDIIVTNGIGTSFPQGYPIAKVVSVSKANYGVIIDVDLIPLVDPNRIEEVFIIQDTLGKNFLAQKAVEEEK